MTIVGVNTNVSTRIDGAGTFLFLENSWRSVDWQRGVTAADLDTAPGAAKPPSEEAIKGSSVGSVRLLSGQTVLNNSSLPSTPRCRPGARLQWSAGFRGQARGGCNATKATPRFPWRGRGRPGRPRFPWRGRGRPGRPRRRTAGRGRAVRR